MENRRKRKKSVFLRKVTILLYTKSKSRKTSLKMSIYKGSYKGPKHGENHAQ